MKILIVMDHYRPAFKAGGPISSIEALVSQLGGEIAFDIVTRDRDLGDQTGFAHIAPHVWHIVGQSRVLYVPPALSHFGLFAHLLRARDYDWIYCNSLFSRFATLWPLLAVVWLRVSQPQAQKTRVIVAPRGECAPSARALKPRRKAIYIKLSQALGLWRDVRWQAATAQEALDIAEALSVSQQNIQIAPDLHDVPPTVIVNATHPMLRHARIEASGLNIVWFSRISAIKNLRGALQILQNVTTKVECAIYGPIEDAPYWHACQAIIGQMPPHIQVTYHGPLDPSEVIQTLAAHDLFFLPTFGESYGHVIAEALQAGLPLLISDQTPWRGLAARGIGQDLPLSDPTAFSRHIDALAQTSPKDWADTQKAIARAVDTLRDQSAQIRQARALFDLDRP